MYFTLRANCCDWISSSDASASVGTESDPMQTMVLLETITKQTENMTQKTGNNRQGLSNDKPKTAGICVCVWGGYLDGTWHRT